MAELMEEEGTYEARSIEDAISLLSVKGASRIVTGCFLHIHVALKFRK